MPSPVARPDLSKSADLWIDLAERISACSRLLRHRLGKCATHRDLSEAQISLLWACLAAPPSGMNQSEMATTLAVSPAYISGTVDMLRRQGYLRRHRSAADRRQRVWCLTASGQGVLAEVVSGVADWTAGLEHRLGGKEIAVLVRLLGELLSALRSEPSAALPGRPTLRRFDPASPACIESDDVPPDDISPGPDARGAQP